jgi:hypothetical protein
MITYKVGYFVGSLSSTSINRELSKALIRLGRSARPWLSRACAACSASATRDR